MSPPNPQLTSKALALTIASRKASKVVNKRVVAKTRTKEDLPALAGNFQDRDDIKLIITCKDLRKNSNILRPLGKISKKIDRPRIRCVVYSTTSTSNCTGASSVGNMQESSDEGEDRDETEDIGMRLPSGCV